MSAIVPMTGIRPVSTATIGAAAALTFIILIFFCHRDKITLKQTGVYFHKQSLPRFLKGFIAGILMVLIWVLLVVWITPVRLSRSAAPGTGAVFSALLLYLLVATREELVFRSYFLTRLATAYGRLAALMIVTAVFILEHRLAGMSWHMAVIGSGMGGLLFGLAAIKTKGIALPLGLHSAWNFGRWMFGLTGSTGIWHYTYTQGSEARGTTTALTMHAIIFLAAIIVLFISGKTANRPFSRTVAKIFK
ncbi:CPBP family intramembrane metalloprotease [Niabella sp. CC-SYL272]|uniref:CPBP family intramembrane glutamic endopeptidase n=1 Tax=Niabella agricola TaxID=2891571 RepID=UPI001F47F962|nr:CPBP family intramembrane glutamic endopeptidase [Niabella agricola]MCF3111327.1 CPBP family intramembrane metalloprotease [Niabella agricola]